MDVTGMNKKEYDCLLLWVLSEQYDTYVRETLVENYASGKVEKLYTGYVRPEELLEKYPEETEALLRYYAREFDEFFFDSDSKFKYSDMNELLAMGLNHRFRDITAYREFMERNGVFQHFVITDKEYNAINDKLQSYIPPGAIRGIAGTYTGYSISYEKFLEIKELYPKEVAFYTSKEAEDDDVKYFIDKVQAYLTQTKIYYKV